MSDERIILAGLGNPGARYAKTRHNIGFRVMDRLASAYANAPWRSVFKGECVEWLNAGQRIVLFKPMTFMNLSGPPLAQLLRFYKVSLGSLIVFHDDVDLKFLCVRIKNGGGNAGHNGLRSLSAHCGNDYCRVRIGVGRPELRGDVHDHVLSAFTFEEERRNGVFLDAVSENISLLLAGRHVDFIKTLPPQEPL